EQHRPAAVLALRDGALERAVLDRMILGAHGQPPLARIEARPLRHRPAQQHAVELEPEIPVHAPRGVLLDDEAAPGLGRDALRRRLAGLREVALLSVGLEARDLALLLGRRGLLLRRRGLLFRRDLL